MQTKFYTPIIVIVLIFVSVGVALFVGTSKYFGDYNERPITVQSPLGPFETIGYWYDSTSKEDWNTLRRITVDVDGSTYDDVCFERLKESVGWHKGNTINVEHESTEDSCIILENSISNPRCRMISYTINETSVEGIVVQGGDGLDQLMFLDGEWKKQIGCATTADKMKALDLKLVHVDSSD